MSSLTDAQIVKIRDEHLPNKGDSFDCIVDSIAFARAIERAVRASEETGESADHLTEQEPSRSKKLRDAGFTRRPSWRSLPKDGDDDDEAQPSDHLTEQAGGPLRAAVELPPLPARRRGFFCTKCGSREATPDTMSEPHPLCSKCHYLGFAEDLDFTAEEMRDYGLTCMYVLARSGPPQTSEPNSLNPSAQLTGQREPGEPHDDTALPAGKVCGDCANLRRCRALFGCKPTNTRCDWSPHRFAQSSDPARQASAEAEGCCVIVDGAPVAWFADPEHAADYGPEYYFGRWLTWRSTAPKLIPLTAEEAAECERRGALLAEKLRSIDEGAAAPPTAKAPETDKQNASGNLTARSGEGVQTPGGETEA